MTFNITKQLPSNIESEKALLGSLILHADNIEKANKIVKPEYFYETKHRIICYAMFDMKQRDIPVDLLTLSERIKNAKRLDDIGGQSYLVELTQGVYNPNNWKRYADVVKDKYKARKTIEVMESLLTTIYDDGTLEDNIKIRIEQLNELVEKDFEGDCAQEKLMAELAEYDGEDRIITFKEVYDNVSIDKSDSMHTGWEQLDKLLTGFRPSHLIVLAGLMKHGKTSFAMDMSVKMQEYNPLWLAIEESIDELMLKFKIRGEQPPKGFSPKSLDFVTTKWIEKKIAEGIKKFKTQIVFIDNLSWVKPKDKDKNHNKADQIEQTMMELKALAKKWNITIVIISHVNGQAKADNVPTFEDLKGSTGIGQVGDKTIIVWRETKKGDRGELEISNNTNVAVQLNRQGGVGNVKMIYENGHFREYDWVQHDDGFGDFSASAMQQGF